MTLELQNPSQPAPTPLESRYTDNSGIVQLTGIQALTRLPVDQHRRDRATGLNVGTYISGYEGSPLAGYDLELARHRELLDDNDIHHRPGLNEESGATAIQGTQLVQTLEGATRDGVVGIWYGKAPGLDRAADALRHGNLMGAHPNGGAVVLVGDDPAAKSSTVPCASELALADLGMPVLYPADSQEVLEMGQHAVELSRASGLWVGMKIVTAVADGSSSVDLHSVAQQPRPRIPQGAKKHVPTGRLLQPTLGPLERDMVTTRWRIAREYGALNGLNTIVGASDSDSLGIVAPGRTWHEVIAALGRHGIDLSTLSSTPVRLLKVGMPWPMDEATIAEFADGLDEVLVIEEKRSFIESAVRDALYGTAEAPLITGKRNSDGAELIPAYGELDASTLERLLARRLPSHGLSTAAVDVSPGSPNGRLSLPLTPAAKRAPYFCSGCPHNSSTKPAESDSLVGAGIGCHTMVLLMDDSQVGHVTGISQMGGEGLQWVGMEPFIDRDHFVQNIGDGTFDHSGSLAVRAAVASGANITYKVLYNSAVAMTGGQSPVGEMSVERVLKVLQAENVSRIIVTTEDPKRYRGRKLPRGVQLWHRDRMEEAQRTLAETPGVTVLLHDQECSTELRRKRKRGTAETPTTRIAINERICEGCGDCGVKSNCLSVQPVDTDLGRKTRIHQTSCNFDYSCVKGDCPAFISVESTGQEATVTAAPPLEEDDLPAPPKGEPKEDFGVRMTGVGGTGVVTSSQILATAGLLAGWYARSLDQTGLAQKGGAVVSDVRFTRGGAPTSNKLIDGECDLYLGYDVLVAAEEANLSAVSGQRTTAVINTALVPTGHMVADASIDSPDTEQLSQDVAQRAASSSVALNAAQLVRELFGNDQYLNTFMIGVAYQTGALPIAASAIEEAIQLNGAAVESNVQAFRRGRQHIADPQALMAAAAEAVGSTDSTSRSELQDPWAQLPGESELQRLLRTRADDLVGYQDEKYAQQYRQVVEEVRDREELVSPGRTDLAEAAARYLYKLMAYKDEYEVARLALDAQMDEQIAQDFGRDAKTTWHLHPPMLRELGMDRKIKLGSWFRPAFSTLKRMKRLRGTPLDPFGRAHVRVLERELISEYRQLVDYVLAKLTEQNHAQAVTLLSLPDMVRGYESIKLDNVERYRQEKSAQLAQFDAV
ncbi:indolepyruvate ferredoxin oxidoreductase family protein [Garicola koreensis]|uniref:Indolepyruvate ferredoxin oxidoreductase n=1 Tax=Garicola koreensis TaxID=1262554 RepID=A0A7W5TRM7_9MICC|nr:indolepyruvate ferredoxin oxidoreductase family protein [Garicola koreensis]MBB3666453.1 indolepyruvate ferredoxin oxidoreductase [Garicola koreensis]